MGALRNMIIRSHNIMFYEHERLDFDWNERIDGYLTASRNNSGSDSDDETGVLTPPGTPAILPQNNSNAPGNAARDADRSPRNPSSTMAGWGDLQPNLDQPDILDESESE